MCLGFAEVDHTNWQQIFTTKVPVDFVREEKQGPPAIDGPKEEGVLNLAFSNADQN